MAIGLAKYSGHRRKCDLLPLKIGLRHSNDCERQRLGGLQKQPAQTCNIFSAKSLCTPAVKASNFLSGYFSEEFEGTSFQGKKSNLFQKTYLPTIDQRTSGYRSVLGLRRLEKGLVRKKT